MEDRYFYEPPVFEILITELLGNTLVKPYYRSFVKQLMIRPEDNILDYCAGCGIIAKLISKKLGVGRIVYADVSERWLSKASKKQKNTENAFPAKIDNFESKLPGGPFDLIVVHFVIHDFPKNLQLSVINQLTEQLNPSGRLLVREPLGDIHGFRLYELINLLEHTKKLSYEYQVKKSRLLGEYVDITAAILQCH